MSEFPCFRRENILDPICSHFESIKYNIGILMHRRPLVYYFKRKKKRINKSINLYTYVLYTYIRAPHSKTYFVFVI